MEHATSVGERLRRARKWANLTQQQVADAIHVNRATYTNYENGKIELSTSRIQEIAPILGVSVSYLLDGSPDTLRPSNASKKESADRMTNDTLESLMESLRELASAVKMHKELEMERIAADRERVRTVDAKRAQAEADRAEAEKSLARANELAQENIRDAMELARSSHSSGPEDESGARQTSYGR